MGVDRKDVVEVPSNRRLTPTVSNPPLRRVDLDTLTGPQPSIAERIEVGTSGPGQAADGMECGNENRRGIRACGERPERRWHGGCPRRFARPDAFLTTGRLAERGKRKRLSPLVTTGGPPLIDRLCHQPRSRRDAVASPPLPFTEVFLA